MRGAPVRRHDRLVAWLFPDAPPERLAMSRILVGAFAWVYVLVQAPAILSLRSADAARFEPVGVLAALPAPVPDAVLVSLFVLAAVSGVAFVAGIGFRVVGPAFALTVLFLCTYRSSWGQVLWLENLMVLHLLIVGFARSADALVWPPRPAGSTPSEAYGVPVRLAALVTVATYMLAAIAKLRITGIEWITSDSLRHHIAAAWVRADLLGLPASPVGRWIVKRNWLFTPFAAVTVLGELLAPLALFGRRLRLGWVALAWLMHVSIAVAMFVVFPYPLLLVAYAPLFDLEHLRARLERR